jgi:hypothetical protein
MKTGTARAGEPLVEQCAIIAELYQDLRSDGSADDHIRAMFAMH